MASRKEYVARRDASKVYLLDSFARWRSFKEERNLRTDSEVAKVLLEEYVAKNVNVCNAETQTESPNVMAAETQTETSSSNVPFSPVMPTTSYRKTAAAETSTPVNYASRRRLSLEGFDNTTLSAESLRFDQSPFDEVTQTASSGESDNLPILDYDETVTLLPPEHEQFQEEYDEFNTTIHGHDEDFSEDDEESDGNNEGSDCDVLENKSPSYHSTVKVVTPQDAIKMEKCIVFTGSLMLLITSLHGSVCKRQQCGSPLLYRKTYVGTCLVVSWQCQSGHVGGRWAAQPSCNKIRAGNLSLASALLLSGNSYAKVGLMFNFCNLQYFSSTLFNQYQKLYIIPAINEFWEQHKQRVWREKAGKDVILSGDGRNDSPGHSAQYCTYSLADMEDRMILQMNVVDVREAGGKSNNMERIGFERGMDILLQSPMVLKEVVTDGHLEIAALMKREEKYKTVTHQNDIWHGGKSVAKKVNAAAKQRQNDDLTYWAPSIRNHFWHCAKTCNNNAKNLKDKWIGILHHVVNEHEWVLEEGVNAGKCAHDPLSGEERNKPWLKKESSAHKALTKIVLDTRFLNTLGYYINFRHTGFLESFHNIILMYAPKRHAYSYGRRFSKRTQRWCHVRVLEPKTYSYIPSLMQKVFETRAASQGTVDQRIVLSNDDPRWIAPNIAPIPPPSVQAIVEEHQSRF